MEQASSQNTREPSRLDRVGGKIILALFAALIGLAGAGAGGVFLLKPGTAHAGRPAAETARPSVNYAPLPAMSFTLSDGTRLRELRVRVVLEMEPSAQPKAVESFAPRIASAMNNVMLDVDPDELRGQDGSFFIKDAVMQTATKELRPMKVRQVLVQEMLLR